jgi:hypothetical protein
MRFGFATGITSTTGRDGVLSKLSQYNCDSIRVSQGNTAIQGTSRPFNLDYVQACLNAGLMVVYDCNHALFSDGDYTPYLSQVLARCHAVIDYFANYPDIIYRMVVEPVNELHLTVANHTAFIQQIVDDLRAYGWRGWIHDGLVASFSASSMPLAVDDSPYNKFVGGTHWYAQSASTLNWPQTAIHRYMDRGLWSLHTEFGAAYGSPEYAYYTSTNVALMTSLFQWCYDQGTWPSGNAVGMGKVTPFLWMNTNVVNLTPADSKRYESWGSIFKLPTKLERNLTMQSDPSGISASIRPR